MTNLQDAQQDMKNGYGYGAVGVIVSGIVWLLSSLAVNFYSPKNGIWTLIIGGMLIFPVANLIGKLIGLKSKHDKNNPLAKLTMEGTIWMIMCIPLAYGLSLIKVEWFFQGMLMIIGGRHLVFATVYGTRIYWVLGAMLGVAAYILFKLEATAFISVLAGGLIEIILGIIIYILYNKNKNSLNVN